VSSYELASYEPEQREDYLRLLQEAWGELALTGKEFDWWFGENPAGSLMSVARMSGRVVGVASHSLFRMILAGEERLASFSVHATTDAAARGRGIFEALERKHEEEAQERGVAVVLGFASQPTAPIFLGPLGWTEIGRLRVWARPFPHLQRRRSEPVAKIERYRHAGDAGRDWANHIVRDAEYLNWRYVHSPRDYEAYALDGSYAVLAHKEHRGTALAYIADLSGHPRRLLRACLARVKPGARALLGIPAPEHRRAYASLGFVPTRTRLHLMGKALAGELDTDPRAWRFTLGDTDFF
jgi:GNAT superfamily N-acetyltransferase